MKEWIITSCVLLSFLMLLRAVFRKQIGAGLQYALWALALLRLLFPFSISSTPLSVMNFVQPTPIRETAALAAPQQTASVAGTPVIYHPTNSNNVAADPAAVKPEQVISESAAEQNPSRRSSASLLPTVWIAGSVSTALVLFGSNLRFYLRLRRNRSAVNAETCPLPVYLSSGISSPCLFGHSIYITPAAMESPLRLHHVLTHELCHWKQADPLWALLRSLCLVIWWWNPLVWIAAILSRRDCEAACDARAIRQLGEAQRMDYGKTLVDMIAVKTVPGSLFCAATTMTGRDMRERLLRIVHHKKVWMPAVIVVLVLALICAGCTFTGADTPEDENSTTLKSTTLIFQSLEDGLLACSEGEGDVKTVYVRPNGLLSDATLRAMQPGDVLTVQYHNRTADEIDAANIAIDPVSSSTISDPVVPVLPAEDPDDTEPVPPSTEPDPPTEVTLVSPDDPDAVFASLESYFNGSREGLLRRQVLNSFYTNASQIDLQQLLYSGTRLSNPIGGMDELSQPEQEALRKLADYSEHWEQSDVQRITGNEIDIALSEAFGISLADTEMRGLSKLAYLPEFDCYYSFHTDTNARLPIEIVDVLVDGDGYYYMSYRFTEQEDTPVHLSCLERTEDSWRVLYNLENSGEQISGADAQAALDAHQPLAYSVIRPAITPALEYAVSSALLDNARSAMPGYADFVTEAHDVLHLEWRDELLYVDAVSMCKIFNKEEDKVAAIQSHIGCITMAFWVTESGDQLCYQLAELDEAEDPEDPQAVFGGADWSAAAGLQMDDLRESLSAQCDAQSTNIPVLDPVYSDAFLAAMSGSDAVEAVENVMDYCGKQRHILQYQNLGAETRQRDTNVLIEELRGSAFAAEMGWDDAYLETSIAVVQAGFSIEYNPYFGTDLSSGVYQQEFYVCRDPDTRLWRVYSMGERVRLVDYSAGN